MNDIDKNANIEIREIKLKPILGIEPKAYVLSIMIISIISLMCIFFIIPKYKNPGAYLIVSANIANAYIYLNEKYIGRTPLNKYISATKGILRIKRLGFKTYEQLIDIKNKFFGSYSLNINLELDNPEKIIQQRQKELSIMSKIKNTNANIKIIPVFSLISKELKDNPEYIKKFFKSSIPYLKNSKELFNDFLNSYKVVYSIKKNSNNQTIWNSLRKNFNLENRAIFWFFDNLDENQKKKTEDEFWFKEIIKTLDNENIQLVAPEVKKINIKLPGFKKVASSTIETIQNYKLSFKNVTLKSTYNIKEFLIQNQNVTKGEYQNFLDENPKWALSNKVNLIKEQLVDENYLKNFKKMDLNEAITGVSYFSALGYASWYSSSKIPKGFKARLPIALEWELYQKETNSESLIVNEISRKVGFWNFMQNSYFNEIALFKDTNLRNIYDESLTFASLITEIRTYKYEKNNLLSPSTKASFLKSWSSLNIGFRLIIEKE